MSSKTIIHTERRGSGFGRDDEEALVRGPSARPSRLLPHLCIFDSLNL
jgi:hypothetical protein